jgi:glycolate oxidase
MRRELGAGALGLARAVKAAWDPQDILNPGKVLG